jgi:hypothetical protein
MTEMKSYLLWNERKDRVTIFFEDGKDGPHITKNDAIQGVAALLELKKISRDDSNRFIKEINSTQEIPWKSNKNNDLLEVFKIMFGGIPKGAFVLLIEVRSSYSKIAAESQSGPDQEQ